MSEEIFRANEASVSCYCGPVRRDGGVRARYQITLLRGVDHASVSYEEATRLKAALTLSLARIGAEHLAD